MVSPLHGQAPASTSSVDLPPPIPPSSITSTLPKSSRRTSSSANLQGATFINKLPVPPTASSSSPVPTLPSTARSAKTPQTALKYYGPYLTKYECKEILEYNEVYFIGPHAKKVPARHDQPDNNFGYDDDNGDYRVTMQDHLAYRYEVLGALGQGSFGQVLKCLDHKTGNTVAIKLIRNKKRFHAQALTEVKILKKLLDWDPEDKYHTLRMTDYFYFRHHLCVACECMSMNLYEFIKKNNFQGFSVSLIRRFAKQIVQALILLQRHRVIHCDLKPENILLKSPGRSSIKVIDFGSSCFESERVYTYIQSRFYRAPEVILGISYGMPIDMWSLGCILAELHTGIPIFPGESEQEQLACIMEVMGVPDRYLIDQSSRKKLFFDSHARPRPVVNSKGKRRRPGAKPLEQVLHSNDEQFLDFVQGCLQWDPANRMTPKDALEHEWIQQRSRSSHHADMAYEAPPIVPM
ncbi:kinase-like protein [Hesseltinella vesiculosa]|uniref:dual-specificity kinase n=1 Tax=Hesseltinella vesiculosa TaxID=101127 RepID=A0A1X2GU05_9FUNG|nr:kinase-like protein [Hesseltinella vesiculosa]